MLGILIVVTNFISSNVSRAFAKHDDNISKKEFIKARKAGTWKRNTYIDRKGYEREITTNNPVFVRHDNNGDKIMTDIMGNVLVNYSAMERSDEFKKAISENNPLRTVVLWDNKNNNHRCDKCVGYRYKDIATGKLLVARKIKDFTFFMDAETGEYIRPTDRQMQMWKNKGIYEKGLIEAREVLQIHLTNKRKYGGSLFDNGYNTTIAECIKEIEQEDKFEYKVNF